MQKDNSPAPQHPLLEVAHLRVWFPAETNWLGTPTHFLRAVEDVSFNLARGEVLGLVGERGCGKSAICRAIVGLQEVESGEIFYAGRDLLHLNKHGRRAIRREVQMIFGDPLSSLNPRLTIGAALREPMAVHGIVPRKEQDVEARRLIELVGLPQDVFSLYPHQLGDGAWLRVVIARALALRPKLLICDESTGALDADTQAQILNLLRDLRTGLGLSYLFASRDLAAVRSIADRVIVMEGGKIVERGNAEDVLTNPQHEYTKRLVAAITG